MNILVFLQFSLLFSYFFVNVVNVGGDGEVLYLLASYIVLSLLIFALNWYRKSLFFRTHFFVFVVFFMWLSFRLVVDLNDIERLKAITIGTTGGVLTYYICGAIFNFGYLYVLDARRGRLLIPYSILLYLIMIIYLAISLASRMRDDIFYITDADGMYQWPGNLLSIYFILISVLMLAFRAKYLGLQAGKRVLNFLLFVYVLEALITLVCAQLFGSNSATAVVAGVFVLTLATLFTMKSKKLHCYYLNDKSLGSQCISFNSLTMRYIFKITLWSLLLTFTFLLGVGFEVDKLRLFDFDGGGVASISSRVDILVRSGWDQLTFAPLLGDMNVDYLTGHAEDDLHSFFLYILANLGIVGLAAVISLLVLIFKELKNDMLRNINSRHSMFHAMIKFNHIMLLLFLLIFANLTVGVSWIVIWFVIGLISNPFRLKLNID